jgi:hypothetical protein
VLNNYLKTLNINSSTNMKQKIIILLVLMGCLSVQLLAQTPIEKYSQYVDKFTGDFNYSIPLMTVKGKHGESVPITVNYSAGIRVNQNAGPIGLGWNMPIGEITRQVNGVPDDWNAVTVQEKEFDDTYPKVFEYTGPMYFKNFVRQNNTKQDINSISVPQGGVVECPNFDDFYVSGPGIGGQFRGFLLETANIISYNSVTSSNSPLPEEDNGVFDYKPFNKDIHFRFNNEYQYIRPEFYDGNISNVTTGVGIDVEYMYASAIDGTNPLARLDKIGNKVIFYTEKRSDYELIGMDDYIYFNGQNGDGPLVHDNAIYRGNTFTITCEQFKDMYRMYDLGSDINSPTNEGFRDILETGDDDICDCGLTFHVPKWENPVVNGRYIFDFEPSSPYDIRGYKSYEFGSFGEEGDNFQKAPSANYIEYFTNSDLNVEESPIYESNAGVDRAALCAAGNADDIGAFRITTAEGLTYHYSLPLYEKEKRTETHKSNANALTWNFTSNKIQYTYYPKNYVYSWKLTAITGHNFIDNGDNKVGLGDEGFWVSYNYTKVTDNFKWRSPYNDDSYHYNIGFTKTVGIYADTRYYEEGIKEEYNIDYIQTSEQTALFFKSIKNDNHSKPIDPSDDIVPKLKFDKVVLVNTSDLANIDNYNTSNSIDNNNFSGISTVNFNPNYLQLSDYTDHNIASKSLVEVNFATDYTLADGLDNNITNTSGNSGKLTLNSIEIKKNNTVFLEDFEFSYFSENKDFNHEKQDYFGFYNDSYNPEPGGNRSKYSDGNHIQTWSLVQIKEPSGSVIDITYEKDIYNSFGNDQFLYKCTKYDPDIDPEDEVYQGIYRRKVDALVGGGLRVCSISVSNPISTDQKQYYLQYSYSNGSALYNISDFGGIISTPVPRVGFNTEKSNRFYNGCRVGYRSVYEHVKNSADDLLGSTQYVFNIKGLSGTNQDQDLISRSFSSYSVMQKNFLTDVINNTNYAIDAGLESKVKQFGLPVKVIRRDAIGEETYKKEITYTEKIVSQEAYYKYIERIFNYNTSGTTLGTGEIVNNISQSIYLVDKITEYKDGIRVSTSDVFERFYYTGAPKKTRFTKGSSIKFKYSILAFSYVPEWGPKWKNEEYKNRLNLTNLDRLTAINGNIHERNIEGTNYNYAKLNKVLNRDGAELVVNTSDNDLNYTALTTEEIYGGVWKQTNQVSLLNADRKVIENIGINQVYSAKKYDLNNKYVIAEGYNTNYFSFGHTSFETHDDNEQRRIFEGDIIVKQPDISSINSYFSDGSGMPANANIKAHTGYRYLQISTNQTVPLLESSVSNTRFLPNRRYKVSVWRYRNNPYADIEVNIDGNIYNNSTLESSTGDWHLISLYFDVPNSASQISISIKNISPILPLYIDDFDFHPIDAETSFTIYDCSRGLALFNIGKNNRYVRMVYDSANRLIETYKEYKGSEKIIEQKEYHPYNH